MFYLLYVLSFGMKLLLCHECEHVFHIACVGLGGKSFSWQRRARQEKPWSVDCPLPCTPQKLHRACAEARQCMTPCYSLIFFLSSSLFTARWAHWYPNDVTTDEETRSRPQEPSAGRQYGALFCSLDLSSSSPAPLDAFQANCSFKITDGTIIDTFAIINHPRAVN